MREFNAVAAADWDEDDFVLHGFCPFCHADLAPAGSVKASEAHMVRGLTQWVPEGEQNGLMFACLPIYSDRGFSDIEDDEVYETYHFCGNCGHEL